MFETLDPRALITRLKTLEPPFETGVECEVIALAWAHPQTSVRQTAMKVVKKYFADHTELKASLKTLAQTNAPVVKRLRDLRAAGTARDVVEIARHLVHYADRAHCLVFEVDLEFATKLLQVMVRPNYKGPLELALNQRPVSGGAIEMPLEHLPEGIVDAIHTLHRAQPFTQLSLRSSQLLSLPERFAELDYVEHLNIAYTPISITQAIVGMGLKSIDILGTNIDPIAAQAALGPTVEIEHD